MIGMLSISPKISSGRSPCAAPPTARMLSRLMTTSARMIVRMASKRVAPASTLCWLCPSRRPAGRGACRRGADVHRYERSSCLVSLSRSHALTPHARTPRSGGRLGLGDRGVGAAPVRSGQEQHARHAQPVQLLDTQPPPIGQRDLVADDGRAAELAENVAAERVVEGLLDPQAEALVDLLDRQESVERRA